MSNIIKIQTNDNMEQVVSARELHEKLGISKRFSAWWEDQVSRMELQEGESYCTHRYTNANNQIFIDYLVTIDIAKHLCMISGGEKAYQIRQYFIQVEKAWNSPEMVMSRALKLAEKKILNLEEERKILLPKAEFYDAVAGSKTAIDLGKAAKVLDMGIGRNKLFEFLREAKILMNDNVPYQKYIDQGYFRTIEQKYTKPDGSVNISIKTLVYQKGLDFIRKLYLKTAS